MKNNLAYYLILLSILKSAYSSLNDTPIVFVHGYQASSEVWNKFKDNFKNSSFTNLYLFDYSNTTEEPIANNSLLLYKYIVANGILNKEPIFIGHSMGGLVIRHMISENNVKYGKIITLATPNFGAKLAKKCFTYIPLICTHAALDMKPSSDFLNELNNKTVEHYTHTKLLTYYIDKDEQVYAESAIIKTGLYLAVNDYAPKLDIIENGDLMLKNKNSTFINKNIIIKPRNENNSNSNNNNTYYALTCDDFPDDKTCTNETNLRPFESETIHSSIVNKDEVFNNVLNFINGRVKTIKGGPKLKGGNCIFGFTSGTVSWDLPQNVSLKMKMNVLCEEEHHFDNGLAQSQIRKSLSKGTYKFRFFDPETTTLSEWSTVKFYNKGVTCVPEITNHKQIL